MPLYLEADIKIVENASFKDAQTGNTVPYYKVYLQDENGKMLSIGTREDVNDTVGKNCVVTSSAKPDFNKPNLFRLSIVEVKPIK